MAEDYLKQVQLLEGDPGTAVLDWMKAHLGELREALANRGAVLLRGFRAEGDRLAEEATRLLSSDILEDAFWSTPRSAVTGKTFTATEYPGPRTIALHSEMAYMNAWPRLVTFHSIVVADHGGQTTIGNLDDISRDLGPELLNAFAGGVKYVRNYHEGVDIPWQTAFRTSDRKEATQVAKANGMSVTWSESGSLQTSHVAHGCVTAEDGSLLWFNQAHVFHSSNLPANDREALIDLFGADGLPRNAVFANGEPIGRDVIDRVQEVLESRSADVQWEPGDLLFLDNMRFMHGRRPFSGSRRLHVALAQQQSVPTRTALFEATAATPSGGPFWKRFLGL